MTDTPEFSLPANDEHAAVVGRNGSGKSQMGFWLLGQRDLKSEAVYVVDYKREILFQSLRNARRIGFHDTPDEPGLYILESRPDFETQTEDWLWKVWQKGNAGLFVDEGYMLPQINRGAFQAILTQGRSLRIPVITLTQRPVRVSPFAFSEASHIAVFDLNRRKDWQTIEEMTPEGFSNWVPPEFGTELPPYHARWHAVKKKASYILRPVPDAETLIAEMDQQLERKSRWF